MQSSSVCSPSIRISRRELIHSKSIMSEYCIVKQPFKEQDMALQAVEVEVFANVARSIHIITSCLTVHQNS